MRTITSTRFLWAFIVTMVAVVLMSIASLALAAPPSCANAKVVRAIHTNCVSLHYLILKGTAADVSTPPDSPGCTSSEKTGQQVNVSMAFLRADSEGLISESKSPRAPLRVWPSMPRSETGPLPNAIQVRLAWRK